MYRASSAAAAPSFCSIDTVRHASTSSTPSITQKLTITDGQLTDAGVAVLDSGAGHEPWAIVQGVQAALEAVHTTTGLPWWATLMLSGVTLRAAIFPLYVLQMQATQRLVQATLDFRKLYSAYKYARTFTPPSDHKGHLGAILLGRQGVRAVMKKYNTRPIQMIVGAVVYIPIFAVMAYSARDMNLTEADSTYALPVLAALSTYGNLELSARHKSGLWTEVLRAGQYATIFAIPFMASLPQDHCHEQQ
uniref:Uncharacterized protein n=1 Tax=Hyaloperonospora arabidopsidis (strain Emoy2) TaxID=559515 RepID=M4C5Q8_HYAAE